MKTDLETCKCDHTAVCLSVSAILLLKLFL